MNLGAQDCEIHNSFPLPLVQATFWVLTFVLCKQNWLLRPAFREVQQTRQFLKRLSPCSADGEKRGTVTRERGRKEKVAEGARGGAKEGRQGEKGKSMWANPFA